MKKDELTCIHCGARVPGHYEYLECPRCRREGPGIWAHESVGLFRLLLIAIIIVVLILYCIK